MALSNELISQFAKIAKNNDKKTKSEKIVYGTVVELNGSKYVQIDGSELFTPIVSTASVEPNERVTVMIKNHTAIVTGNLSNPSASSSEVDEFTDFTKKYLYHDPINGIQIGDKSSGVWNGFRTQIINSAFNILNSAGSIIASYGEKLIELGKNATDAIIKLCGDKGQIECTTDDNTGDEYLQLTADKLRLKSSSMSSLYSMYSDGISRWEKSATNVSPTNVHLYASECIDPSLVDTLEGWNLSELSVNSSGVSVSTPGNILLDGSLVIDTYGKFRSVVEGSSGIWSYKKWSNGEAELWGTCTISDMDCSAALGSMYRTSEISPGTFPFTVYEPNVTATYESEGYGAMLWAMKNATTSELPHYYLVRPTTAIIVSGEINFYVHGKWTA